MPAQKYDPREIPVPLGGGRPVSGRTTTYDFNIGKYFLKAGSITAPKDPNAHFMFKNLTIQYDLIMRDTDYVVQWKTQSKVVPEDEVHTDYTWKHVLYTYGRDDMALCKRTSVETHLGAALNNLSHTKEGRKKHFDKFKFWKNPIRGIKHLAIKGMDAEAAFRAYKCMHVVLDIPIAKMDVGLRCHMIWDHAERALRIVFEGSKKLSFRKMKTISPILKPFLTQSPADKHVKFAPAAQAVVAITKMQNAGKAHAPLPVVAHPVVPEPAPKVNRPANKPSNKHTNKPVHDIVTQMLKGDGDVLHHAQELQAYIQKIIMPATEVLQKELHRMESDHANHLGMQRGPFGIPHSSI